MGVAIADLLEAPADATTCGLRLSGGPVAQVVASELWLIWFEHFLTPPVYFVVCGGSGFTLTVGYAEH